MKLLPALLLLALCPALCEAETLPRATMYDIVQHLWGAGIPVCLEMCGTTKPEDAITIKQEAGLIEAIPEARRTAMERHYLADCQWKLNAGWDPGKTWGWRQRQFDFDFPKAPVDAAAVLDAAVKADPDYQWEKIAGRYVVFPKEHSFNQPLAEFTAKNLGFLDFMREVWAQVALPAGLHEIGGGEHDDIPWFKHTISLKDTDTRTALTVIVSRLGPHAFWVGGGHTLSFEGL